MWTSCAAAAAAGEGNGFCSGDILRPAPPMSPLGCLPTRARPPPLFLCRFAATDDADVPSPAGSLASAGAGENCRRIAEILSRGCNPMLVGVGAASATADFAAGSPYRILPVGPTSINQTEIGVAAATTTSSGLIISIGDLKDLVPNEADLQERGRLGDGLAGHLRDIPHLPLQVPARRQGLGAPAPANHRRAPCSNHSHASGHHGRCLVQACCHCKYKLDGVICSFWRFFV